MILLLKWHFVQVINIVSCAPFEIRMTQSLGSIAPTHLQIPSSPAPFHIRLSSLSLNHPLSSLLSMFSASITYPTSFPLDFAFSTCYVESFEAFSLPAIAYAFNHLLSMTLEYARRVRMKNRQPLPDWVLKDKCSKDISRK